MLSGRYCLSILLPLLRKESLKGGISLLLWKESEAFFRGRGNVVYGISGGHSENLLLLKESSKGGYLYSFGRSQRHSAVAMWSTAFLEDIPRIYSFGRSRRKAGYLYSFGRSQRHSAVAMWSTAFLEDIPRIYSF